MQHLHLKETELYGLAALFVTPLKLLLTLARILRPRLLLLILGRRFISDRLFIDRVLQKLTVNILKFLVAEIVVMRLRIKLIVVIQIRSVVGVHVLVRRRIQFGRGR